MFGRLRDKSDDLASCSELTIVEDTIFTGTLGSDTILLLAGDRLTLSAGSRIT